MKLFCAVDSLCWDGGVLSWKSIAPVELYVPFPLILGRGLGVIVGLGGGVTVYGAVGVGVVDGAVGVFVHHQEIDDCNEFGFAEGFVCQFELLNGDHGVLVLLGIAMG